MVRAPQIADVLLRILVDPAELLADLGSVNGAVQQQFGIHELSDLQPTEIPPFFFAFQKLAALELFWEQVLRLPRLEYLQAHTWQRYLLCYPRWNTVVTQHPSLREVRVDCAGSFWQLRLTQDVLFGPTSARLGDDGFSLLAQYQILVSKLYYAGRNVFYKVSNLDEDEKFCFVIDMARRREFANFAFRSTLTLPRRTKPVWSLSRSTSMVGWIESLLRIY